MHLKSSKLNFVSLGKNEKVLIIAIDGPAGSGKSFTAKAVAKELGFLYLDTGAMYRCVALAFLRTGRNASIDEANKVLPGLKIELSHKNGHLQVWLNGEDVSDAIRTQEVSAFSSVVSAIAPVRVKMVEAQRRIANDLIASGGGAVIEGRDIGTVVFPNADLKIFMKADVEERARRRQLQLADKEEQVPLETIIAEIKLRDRQDESRQIAPLRMANDAIKLDTTNLQPEEQVQAVVSLATNHMAGVT